jgi:Kdo2-lipid IVA lauroyltransferase/acyltransferase
MRVSISKFFQWPVNIFLCRNLGWKYALIYVHFLGKLFFFINRSEGRKIKLAIRSVFSELKARSELKSVTRRTFQGIFSHYYEKVFNVYAPVKTADIFYRTHILDRGLDAVRSGLSKGRGVLLITGHYGGVEFIPGYLSVNDIPVSIVVKFTTDRLRDISMQKSGTFSTRIIDADKTPNIVKAICENLKENRVVIIQCDEIDEWRPSFRERVSFLGVETFLDRTMNILIKRGGAETVFALMHREENHRYRFIAASGPKTAESYQVKESLSLGAAALQFLENYIVKYPQEWYQWKKYPAIATVGMPESVPESAMPERLLNPSAG